MVRMHSGGTQFIASAILAAMVALPLCAAYTDGEFIAEGALDGTFAVNSADASPFVVSSAAAVAALPPVGYRMGETVEATAQGGAVSSLVSAQDSAASGGSVAFSPAAGGRWMLTNSSGESAAVIVPQKTTRCVACVMLIKPPAPAILGPNLDTFTLPN